jgi:uncharacterized protein
MLAPPRYQPLRPLPAYAYVPGRTPRPSRAAEGGERGAVAAELAYLPESSWAENGEYLWGADLYNAGFFWEAHEAWEGSWRAAAGRDPAQRAVLQGLIQCAAACLKAAAGDAQTCRRLAARGLTWLERARVDRDGRAMGLRVARFVAEFRAFAAADPPAIERRPSLWLSLP